MGKADNSPPGAEICLVHGRTCFVSRFRASRRQTERFGQLVPPRWCRVLPSPVMSFPARMMISCADRLVQIRKGEKRGNPGVIPDTNFKLNTPEFKQLIFCC